MNAPAAPAVRASESAAEGNAAAQAALDVLLQAVQADPSRFDFFALLRRVDALRQQHPRTGQALRPRQEGLRLGQSPDLDFAPAALQQLQLRGDAAPRLVVRFFGLLGPQGPMPLHFTEFVRERLHHHGDATLTHFLDVFHHRLLSLFYRAWAQAQPVVHLDRPHEDRYRAWLAACAGLPAASPALSPAALAFQAGWFAGTTRHPEALVKVLRQTFGVQALDIKPVLRFSDGGCLRVGTARVLQICNHFSVFCEGHHMAVGLGYGPHGTRQTQRELAQKKPGRELVNG